MDNDFNIFSRGVSSEEEGNDTYYLAKNELATHGIPFTKRSAKKISLEEIELADYIICMDEINKLMLERFMPDEHKEKIHLLLDYTPSKGVIPDPYYTRDFTQAFDEIYKGCLGLISHLKEQAKEKESR